MRDFAAASLVVALAVVIGLHLGLFRLAHGYVSVGEPSQALWTIECVLAAAIFIFGLERFVTAIRRETSRDDE